MDFPTILVLATAITGVIWAADAWYFAPKRQIAQGGGSDEADKGESDTVKMPVVVEYARSFFPIILAVLVIRSFIVEPFRIPSGSMMPTLLIGDFIVVNKFSYGLRLPVSHTKILDLGEPQRGDVIVFRYPENPSVDYIKRVIGVPGDHVVYKNKRLTINGEEVPVEFDAVYQTDGSGAGMNGAGVFTESLFDVEHQIMVMHNRPEFYEYYVKDSEYFVMGDNRDNSRDSRFWGPVPEENLVGKAVMIWMNWDSNSGGVVSWGRIGNSIE